MHLSVMTNAEQQHLLTDMVVDNPSTIKVILFGKICLLNIPQYLL